MHTVFPTPADAKTLLEWFTTNGIAYPWSAYHSDESINSYAIWISEVMLQQTTVRAVLPRYYKWMFRFPNMQSLAEASEDEVYREWEGLGYYSRARNLHSAAKESCAKYGGKLPQNMEELQSLSGVGNYIAAAVASFAWNERVATIDANIRRIVQRVEAAELWTRELEQGFKERLVKAMPVNNPGKLNAALMQFGQQLCLPRRPKCTDCPLSHRCSAMQTERQEEIPGRKRKKIIQKSTELAILINKQQVWLERRTSGPGTGLWVFPKKSSLVCPGDWVTTGQLKTVVHTYTRYRDSLVLHLFKPMDHTDTRPTSNGQWVSLLDIDKYAMPTAYRRIADMLISDMSFIDVSTGPHQDNRI